MSGVDLNMDYYLTLIGCKVSFAVVGYVVDNGRFVFLCFWLWSASIWL